MRHRVRSFGGILDIESPPQGGTRVRARLPLAAIVLYLVVRHVPESSDGEAGRGLDAPGALLVTLGAVNMPLLETAPEVGLGRTLPSHRFRQRNCLENSGNLGRTAKRL